MVQGEDVRESIVSYWEGGERPRTSGQWGRGKGEEKRHLHEEKGVEYVRSKNWAVSRGTIQGRWVIIFTYKDDR